MAPQNDSEDPGTTLPADGGLVQVGQRIRTQRQARGLSADQLAATMHMGVEQLTALELGDEDRLPEPVFIKAMVRRLASHLRMNADELVEMLGPTVSNPRPIKALTTAAPWPKPAANPPQPRRTVLLLVPVLLLLGGGAGYTLWQVKLSDSDQPSPPTEAPNSKAVVQDTAASQPADQQPSASNEAIILEISSAEPSWIALRRSGNLEFQGTLDEPIKIEDPENVEIYAGRPDLVIINVSDQEPRRLSTINDVRWQELIPER
jgi:cytoskeleton protein RodZ